LSFNNYKRIILSTAVRRPRFGGCSIGEGEGAPVSLLFR
jgi:hypothetical protein